MSKMQKGVGAFLASGAGVAVVIFAIKAIFFAGEAKATTITQTEADARYATKESVGLLREDLRDVKASNIRIEGKLDQAIIRQYGPLQQ